MRAHPTPAELKALSLILQTNLKYKFQLPIGFYIVDFLIPEKMLILEIDGSSHDGKEIYDAKRDLFLSNLGFTILHIKNQDVDSVPAILGAFPNVAGYTKQLKQALCTARRLRRQAAKTRTRKKSS